MNSQVSTPPFSENSQIKDNKFKTELETIFHYLKENVCTASMLAEVTGIKQKNICRYKRDLERCGYLREIKKDRCPITGFKAWFITTDPKLFPKSNQTKLF